MTKNKFRYIREKIKLVLRGKPSFFFLLLFDTIWIAARNNFFFFFLGKSLINY